MIPGGGSGADGWPDPVPGNASASRNGHGRSADDRAVPAASAGWPGPVPADGHGDVVGNGRSADDWAVPPASGDWPDPAPARRAPAGRDGTAATWMCGGRAIGFGLLTRQRVALPSARPRKDSAAVSR